MKITDIIQAIGSGELDGHEDAIYKAFRHRHQFKAQLTASALGINDRVEIFNIRPKHLNGCKGKITALPRPGNSQRFDVLLDEAPIGRFGNPELKQQRGIPAACLRPI